MGLEGFLKNADRNKKLAATPASTPPEKPESSLADLHTGESQAFGEFIASKGDPAHEALAQKLLSKTDTAAFDPGDLTTLMGLRKEYLERKSSGEKLVSTLEKNFDEMMEKSAKLKEIVEAAGGKEKFLRITNQGFREMAIKDPTELQTIATVYKDIADFETTIDKPLTEKIDKFCKKNRLNAAQIEKVLQHPRYIDRHDALRKLLRGEMTRGHGVWDTLKARFKGEEIHGTGTWNSLRNGLRLLADSGTSLLGFGSKGKANQLAGEDLEALLNARTAVFEGCGDYFRALVETRRPEMREALLRTAFGDEPAYKEGFSTKETFMGGKDELKKFNAEFTPEKIVERAQAFRATEEAADPGCWADVAKAVLLVTKFSGLENGKVTDRRAAYNKKPGFWANMAQHLLGARPVYDASTDPNVTSILK